MADITLKLIWYRLGETRENMAEGYGRFLVWYKNFSWRNLDIVDMFFVSWIIFGVVVVGLVHIYFKCFGRKAVQKPGTAHPTPRKRHLQTGPAGVESCQWLNAVINWVYLNYNSTPEFVNSWLNALNEQAKKQQGAVQVRFDRILAGSLPPRVTNVHTEAGPTDNFTLHGSLDASELGFQILVSKQTATEVQLTNCDINVQLLRGELSVQTVFAKDEVHLFVKFEGTPEIALLVKPHQKAEGSIDVSMIEEKVKTALSASVCHFRLNSSQVDGPMGSARVNDSFARAQNHVPVNSAAPPKPPRSPEALLRQDKRLLVKVIKASGLGAKDFGCSDPFCTVEMDDPHQRHNTSVVKNTVNPFWDESFLFDLNGNTREILFEVFDREKVPGEDFLGMAAVSVDELRKTPSSRHIIPLAGRQPGSGKGGNLTVEFLFMDPAEITDMQPDERDILMATAANLSPRRRIETKSPNRIEKTESSLEYSRGRSSNDSSPQSTRPLIQTPTDLPLNGTESVVDTAIRDVEQRAASQRPQTPTKSIGTVIVTRVKRMTQSTPTEELKDDGRLSSTSSDVREKKPKRSSSIASTLRKRFSRNKKPRSHSADRAGSEKHLRVPDQYASGSKSTEDLDQVEIPGHETSNLQKSKSIGSSLKKLFRMRRRHSHGQGDHHGAASRDSSITRSRDRLPPHDGHDTSHESSHIQPSPSPEYRRPQGPRLSTSSAV